MAGIVSTSENVNLFGESVAATPAFDRDRLADALYALLHDISLLDFVKMITNEYTEALEYIGLCKGEKRCQKTSLLFNPHRLDTHVSGYRRSVYQAFSERDFFSGLARVAIYKFDKLASDYLYQALQLHPNHTPFVFEFPPHVARTICLDHRVMKSSLVLDPCAGWGGRMLGVSSVADEYVCYEPSSLTAAGLGNLTDFIRLFRPEFSAAVNMLPFEDSREYNECYDFALTSPPYFDTEKYTDEQSNSLNRYSTFDSWCDSFYLPMIDKVMRQLKQQAAFVLNIGDRRYPLSKKMLAHCDGRYNVEKLPNYLSGKSGLGKDGTEGEMFFRITKG